MREEREKLVLAGSLSPKGTELPASYDEQSIQNQQPKTPAVESLKDSLKDSLRESGRRGSISSLPFSVVKQLDKSNEARPPGVKIESPLRTSTDGLTRRASRDNILLAKKASSERLNFSIILKSAPKETPNITEEIIQ